MKLVELVKEKHDQKYNYSRQSREVDWEPLEAVINVGYWIKES
jgi:hypothetical protein